MVVDSQEQEPTLGERIAEVSTQASGTMTFFLVNAVFLLLRKNGILDMLPRFGVASQAEKMVPTHPGNAQKVGLVVGARNMLRLDIPLPGTSGIYIITNIVTNHLYVGSAKDIRRRWYAHLSLLRKNTHHSPHLQNAWNKYGEDCFAFQIVEIVPIELCIQREQYWINTLHPVYNAQPQAGSSLGHKHSPERIEKNRLSHLGKTLPAEQRAKMSASMKGKKRSGETRAKISAANKGKTFSPETLAKQSEAHKGQVISAEQRAKIAAGNKGKVMSEETRIKMCAAQKGRVISEEHKAKLSVSHLGSTDSPETKAKKSAARIAYWARMRQLKGEAST